MMINSSKSHVERSVSIDQRSQHVPVSQGKRTDDGQFDDAPNEEHTNSLKAGPISSGESLTYKPSLNKKVLTGTPTNQTPMSDLRNGELRNVSPRNDTVRPGQDMKIISEEQVSPTDVLCGRGGGTNNHPGNKYFRILVSRYRPEYVIAKKAQKSQIARRIVEEIRSRAAENLSGGRFLKRNIGNNTWYDIGNKRATEKTSQALREGLANKMRQAMMANGISSFTQVPNESYESYQMNSPPASVAGYHQYQYYHAMKKRRVGASF